MTTETLDPGAVAPVAGEQPNADGVQPEVPVVEPKVGDAPAEGAKTDEVKADDAPAEYAFTAPEGVELDADQTAQFTAIAKELKLPAEAAQKIVDLATKAEVARVAAFTATVQGWAAEVKADPVLGGDKLEESLAVAKRAIDLGPPELKTLLQSTGMGNHPAVFKWAHAVGKALSPDKFVQGGNAPAGNKSAEHVLYPNNA
jgi:hypothetical protein